MISVIILTKNEENNIERCLESVLWADEIVVVDDYSIDNTKNIINVFCRTKNRNIKIFDRRLNGDFASQRNWGMEKTTGEWILFLDADEEITTKLREEIVTAIKTATSSGFKIKRKDYFLGKWLKFGETNGVHLLRLIKKDAGEWVGRVHEELKANSNKIGLLENPILHRPHQTLSRFLAKINFYSTIRAEELHDHKCQTNFFWIILYPKAKFLQNYFLKLGFLDGMAGLMMVLTMSFHSFLVRSKLYMLNLK